MDIINPTAYNAVRLNYLARELEREMNQRLRGASKATLKAFIKARRGFSWRS